jgi:hypothetical protein
MSKRYDKSVLSALRTGTTDFTRIGRRRTIVTELEALGYVSVAGDQYHTTESGLREIERLETCQRSRCQALDREWTRR